MKTLICFAGFLALLDLSQGQGGTNSPNYSPSPNMKIEEKGLDEVGSYQYEYLRSVGNDWKYYVYEVNPRLVERLYKLFQTLDITSDEKITISELLFWPGRLKRCQEVGDKECESLKVALEVFGKSLGVDDAGLKREDWIETIQVLAEAEAERARRGETTCLALVGDAFFNVLDNGDDDKLVHMQEIMIMMTTFQVPQEAAYSFFEMADTNKKRELEREQVYGLLYKFWLGKYDSQYDRIYANKY